MVIIKGRLHNNDISEQCTVPSVSDGCAVYNRSIWFGLLVLLLVSLSNPVLRAMWSCNATAVKDRLCA